MKIILETPLRISESIYNYNKLAILKQQENVEVEKPFPDYVVIPANNDAFNSKIYDVITKKKILGLNKSTNIAAISFKNPEHKANIISDIRSNNIVYDYVSYKERLYIRNPEFIESYQHGEVSYLSFDIETMHSKGKMPDPTKDKIVSIAWKLSYENQSHCIYFDNVNICDKGIIEEFMNILRNTKFDILVGYNHKTFDIPFLIKRAQYNNINWLDIFTPISSQLSGRNFILLDLYESVKKDQTLTGNVDNFKMKTIGKFFNLPTIEIDTNNINDLVFISKNDAKPKDHPDIQTLIEYNLSDVFLTENIAKIYLYNSIYLANLVKVDLDNIINGYASIIGTVIMGRILRNENIISLGSNIDRYFEGGYIKELCSSAEGKKSYQGAISKAVKTGKFTNVAKYDFSSQYPSAIVTLNIGSDTTRLINTKPYDTSVGIVKIHQKKPSLILEIPDNQIMQNIIVEIDMEHNSALSDEIIKLKEQRSIFRKDEKEYKDKNEKTLELIAHSQQIAVKVIMNSLYGYLGLKNSKYGDLIGALVITAFCRDLTTYIVDNLFKDNTIEIDTDGIYVENIWDQDNINKMLTEFINSKYGVDNKMMAMDHEGTWKRMYVYKAKNYILKQEKDGIIKYKKTGAVFKSSRYSQLYRKVIEEMIICLMEDKNHYKLLNDFLTFENMDTSLFIQRTNVRSSTSYANENSMVRNLSEDFENETEEEITDKASVEYIKTFDTTSKYELYNPDEKYNLDTTYYSKNVVLKIPEILGLPLHSNPETLLKNYYKEIQYSEVSND